jgi:hypothetical protein
MSASFSRAGSGRMIVRSRPFFGVLRAVAVFLLANVDLSGLEVDVERALDAEPLGRPAADVCLEVQPAAHRLGVGAEHGTRLVQRAQVVLGERLVVLAARPLADAGALEGVGRAVALVAQPVDERARLVTQRVLERAHSWATTRSVSSGWSSPNSSSIRAVRSMDLFCLPDPKGPLAKRLPSLA